MCSVMHTAINDYGATDTCADRQRPCGICERWIKSRLDEPSIQGKSQSEGMAYTASANLYGESA